MITLGIDPGATGAIAALDDAGALLWVHDMPYADGAVLAPVLAELMLMGDGDRTAWVERAQVYPGQSGRHGFVYGTGYGVILGVLGTLSIPTQRISPNQWKAKAGLSADKGASRRRAVELWPGHAEQFARVKDDGRAEACLIARHGWMVERRGEAVA